MKPVHDLKQSMHVIKKGGWGREREFALIALLGISLSWNDIFIIGFSTFENPSNQIVKSCGYRYSAHKK